MALTQEQIDFFSENGYVSCGKILGDDELQLLRQEYDRELGVADARNLSETLVKDGQTPPQRMLQIMQMCERNIHFRRLLYNERILDMVESLIGPNLMLFHDQALYKPAHTGGAVFWHQDNGYWKCAPATLVSCWLTLDDADKDNGAMQLIPGSHLKPVHHIHPENRDRLLEIHGVDTTKAKVVALPAGGCMIHHCQTLHYTAPNTTGRQRRAFAIHFMTPGTRDREGKVMSAGFKHPILRLRA